MEKHHFYYYSEEKHSRDDLETVYFIRLSKLGCVFAGNEIQAVVSENLPSGHLVTQLFCFLCLCSTVRSKLTGKKTDYILNNLFKGTVHPKNE